MIYTNNPSIISLKGLRESNTSVSFTNGTVVRVVILGKTITGATKIVINGVKFSAVGLSQHQSGSQFDAVVRIKNGTIFLNPVHSESASRTKESFLTKSFDLPDTVYSHLLLSNLQTLGARLIPQRLKLAVSYLQKCTQNKEIACEAAAILEDSGFDWDEVALSRLISIMSGEKEFSSEDKQSSQDFLNLLKSTKKEGKTWIIHPFVRFFGTKECSGSIRFLVSIPEGSVESVKLTVLHGERSINFLLFDTLCTFKVQPEISSFFLDKLTVYLSEALSCCGFSLASESTLSDTAGLPYTPLDIEL